MKVKHVHGIKITSQANPNHSSTAFNNAEKFMITKKVPFFTFSTHSLLYFSEVIMVNFFVYLSKKNVLRVVW